MVSPSCTVILLNFGAKLKSSKDFLKKENKKDNKEKISATHIIPACLQILIE